MFRQVFVKSLTDYSGIPAKNLRNVGLETDCDICSFIARSKYLPRTPPEKSVSGISVSSCGSGCLFISIGALEQFAFTGCDDSNAIFPIRVSHVFGTLAD